MFINHLLGEVNGGGLFKSETVNWLNGLHDHKIVRTDGGLNFTDMRFNDDHFGHESLGVYYPRLLRDGWKLGEYKSISRWNELRVFEKKINKNLAAPENSALPKRRAERQGSYWDEHELENISTQTILKFPDWEWAEKDDDAVIWAENDCLYRAGLGTNTLGTRNLLHGLNDYKFKKR